MHGCCQHCCTTAAISAVWRTGCSTTRAHLVDWQSNVPPCCCPRALSPWPAALGDVAAAAIASVVCAVMHGCCKLSCSASQAHLINWQSNATAVFPRLAAPAAAFTAAATAALAVPMACYCVLCMTALTTSHTFKDQPLSPARLATCRPAAASRATECLCCTAAAATHTGAGAQQQAVKVT